MLHTSAKLIKIYFLTTWFQKGGAETALKTLASGLKDNYDITIFVFNPKANNDLTCFKGIKVEKLKTFKIYKSFSVISPIKLISVILELRTANILFAHQYYTFSSFIGALSSLIWNKPLIIKPLAPIPTEYPPTSRLQIFIGNFLNRSLFYFVLKRAKFITVTSNFEKNYIQRIGIDSGKVRVIVDGIDDIFYEYEPSVNERLEFIRTYKIPRGSKILLYVGRICEMKGLSVLVKVLLDVLKVFPHTYLFLVGEGPTEYKNNLKSLIHELGVRDNVIFTGYVDKDLLHFYATADVFVNPSFMECSPMAVREAIAMGLHVVATNVGGTKEFVRNNLDGLLVPVGEGTQLGDAIIELLSRINGKLKTFKEHFTWDSYINGMKKIFEKSLVTKLLECSTLGGNKKD